MTSINKPSGDYTFGTSEIDEALRCLESVGFCVIRKMIPQNWVNDLKVSVDQALDPERNLPLSSNRYHMAFAEVSRPLWRLADHPGRRPAPASGEHRVPGPGAIGPPAPF